MALADQMKQAVAFEENGRTGLRPGRWPASGSCSGPALIIGVIFGVLFLHWRPTNPMIIAHTLINSVAFIGQHAASGPRVVATV